MKINKKIASSVAGASIILTLLGFLSKGIGFVREIIYANNFGLSAEFDLFLTSIALPNLINTAVIYLCQHYFVPSYNRVKNSSQTSAVEFFNYTFWWFSLGGVLLALLLYLASDVIIGLYLSSISPQAQQKGLQIFQLLLITIPINTAMSVIMAYLQANFKFVYPAFSLMILNIVVIVLIILFADLFQIFVLPISFVAAYVIAFIFLLYNVRGNLKFNFNKLIDMKFNLTDMNILLSLIFIEGLSLSYVFIDRFFVGKVSEGGIAALNYAFVVFTLPISLFSIPLITTMFSKFSNSRGTLKTDLTGALGINFYIMIPFAFLFFFWGDVFLQLFYERGKFTPAGTIKTFEALKYYSSGLIFLTAYYLVVKALYSINKYKTILIISIIAFLLKLLFNFLFVENLEQNGLALSTTCIYVFLCITGSYLLIKEVKQIDNILTISNFGYFLLNAVVSFIIAKFFLGSLLTDRTLTDLVAIILFITIYTLNSLIMNDNEYRMIKNTVRNFFKQEKLL
jgi:putative peptidoglycan lipid II flippase